jgi:MFS superfamily sulfate permease-like transporter
LELSFRVFTSHNSYVIVVIEGYKTGIFLVVGAGQLKYVIQRPVAPGNFFEIMKSFFEELPHAEKYSLAYAFSTIAIIILIKLCVSHKWPGHTVLKFVCWTACLLAIARIALVVGLMLMC